MSRSQKQRRRTGKASRMVAPSSAKGRPDTLTVLSGTEDPDPKESMPKAGDPKARVLEWS